MEKAAKKIIDGIEGYVRGETCKHVIVCRRCHGTGKVRNPKEGMAMTKCKTCKGVGRMEYRA